MSKWIEIGYKWKTETACRVREFLKENRIPFRMPFDEMFFQSMYHLPHRDHIWGDQGQEEESGLRTGLAGKGRVYTQPQQ